MTRVYIDIDIGDADAHARERVAYDLAVEYVRERGHVVGIDNAAEVSSLDDESRDLVRESFRSDRKWADRGVENLRCAEGETRPRRRVCVRERERERLTSSCKLVGWMD